MNYLQLCQALMREAGIPGTLPTTQNQVGEALRVVNWIAEAYNEIQLEHAEWEFLRADALFNTVAGTNQYTGSTAGLAAFNSWRWRNNDWRAYLASSGTISEQPLEYLDYASFRQVYGFGANRAASGRPIVITEKPDQSLLMWPNPSDIYSIVGEYYQAPAALSQDTDVPNFAAQFHMAIVWRALMLYGAFEGDSAVFTFGQAKYSSFLDKMEDKYLPKWHSAEPMA